mgnify:CR=1 FL=1
MSEFDKALDAQFGKGFSKMAKKIKAESKTDITYDCGCHYAGKNSWNLCDEHQDMIQDELSSKTTNKEDG